MRLLAALAALVCLLTACTGDSKPQGITLDNRPVAASKVDVDTPALREAKAAAGIADCTPGRGGGELPSLTLPCLGGGTAVDLASLKGPMLLSFWGSWCGPCAEEMPALQAFADDYADQVPLLAVDYQDQYPASALEQMQERGVTYPSLADPGGDVQQFDEFAKIPGMPMLVFVDADGAIAHREFGGLDSEAQIVDLVEEHLGVAL
ncbi:TlpA family protein disulfide reductase [Nocardioides anomalus]|uniref:TlpA family protein disulfide reductase n=1 Tax=Nocardioides anomalus TaxID=2712223 RepID=A0A6G6WHW1_9ACTN|nr:TlpA disulfide reductase family protein [Nocardioides anomalus]QIG44918.1 TlpA family protein disulfide reductase [Nocardioides anomalus]